MPNQDDSDGPPTWVWVLLGLGGVMVLTCCAGIVAALAIPQFMQSVRKAKTAEVEETLDSTVDSVRHYYSLNKEVPGVGMRLRTSKRVPTGGDKVVVSPKGLSERKRKLWERLDWPPSKTPMYFQYTYRAEKTGDTVEIELVALSDFEEGGPKHRVTQELRVRNGDIQVQAPYVENEGQ